ncbi:acetyl esterase/lipase [Pseudochelatococcus lubricantis]|uniref:Acetyl esterase/lipase n=1 Tax=Pseudochelatococcus lubricantis TaxID=1538102 RepID=A0ABX0V0S5_9HYPH|nr:alpha/beta hydrolase [Pseudochelatococcus lubricantis]NIJ56706.1 acetyl esterase/lipase [Pseudochelatococcus lubricantis]
MTGAVPCQLPALDAALFDSERIDAETRKLNTAIVDLINAAPDQWSLPPQEVRDLRAQGRGAFPAPILSPRARTVEIPGPRGAIPLRIVEPRDSARGAFLHIHGGGWTFGTADGQDARLERFADNLGLVAISVEYRLAPEHPYPAGPDDCEAAALWLAREGAALFGAERLFIGGESAGAHLSLVTLLRLRDRHGLSPFSGAVLTAGCFDLGLTPSVRHWGEEKLVLNTRDIEKFVESYLGGPELGGHDPRHPDISPLYADLSGLPPAHLIVGTRDPLVDDTLFLHTRWVAAGNRAELAVWTGGAHVFVVFPGTLADRALARSEAFLATFL